MFFGNRCCWFGVKALTMSSWIIVLTGALGSRILGDELGDSQTFAQAQVLLWNGRYRDAEQLFSAVINKGDASLRAASCLNRALCRRLLQNWRGAVEDYDRCLQADSGSLTAVLGKAVCLMETDKSEEALTEMNRVIASPNELLRREAYYYRGLLHQRLNEDVEACVDFDKALQEDSPFLPAYGAYAESELRVGDELVRREAPSNARDVYDHALRNFESAITCFPGHWSYWAGQGKVYQALGQIARDKEERSGIFQKAADSFSQALHLHSDEPSSYLRRAQCYVHLAKWDHARSDYVTAAKKGRESAGQVIADLVATLRDARPAGRSTAARTLGELGTEAHAVTEPLVNALADSEFEVRSEAAKALRLISANPRIAVPALARVLSDREAKVRYEAAVTLTAFGKETAQVEGPLKAAFKDPNPFVRLNAAFALWNGTGSGVQVLPVLLECAAHDEADVRRAAVFVLSRLGPQAQPALPQLQQTIGDKNLPVRYQTIRALAAIGPEPKEVLPTVALALCDKSDHVVQEAAGALWRWGKASAPALPGLMAALSHPSPEVRRRIAAALGNLGADARGAALQLSQVLHDADEYVQLRSAESLLRIGSGRNEALAALVKNLSSRRSDVRSDAVTILGTIRPATMPVVSELSKRLSQDPVAEVRSDAAAALGSIGLSARVSVPYLINALKDGDSRVREQAARTLGLLAPVSNTAVGALMAAISDSEPEVRYEAVWGLGEIGSPARAAVPTLVPLVKHTDAEVRAAATFALGEIAPDSEEVVPALLTALKDEDPMVRMVAIDALALTLSHPRVVVPALAEALNDQVLDNRMVAIRSLAKLGPESETAVPSLLRELKSPRSVVRAIAATALGQIGSAPQQVVPSLAELLSDDDATVRYAAAVALGAFGDRAVPALDHMMRLLNDRVVPIQEAVARSVERIQRGKKLPTRFPISANTWPTMQVTYSSRMATALAKEIDILKFTIRSSSSGDLLRLLSRIQQLDDGVAAVPFLIHQLQIGNHDVRRRATWLLGLIGPPALDAVPELITRMSDDDHWVCEGAIRALGRIGPRANLAVDELVKRLEDEDPRIRVAVVAALQDISPLATPVSVLIRLLGSGGDNERLAAVQASCTLGASPELVEPLAKALTDRNSHVRYWSAEALGRLGPLASQALPALEKLRTQEASAVVRVVASSAIDRIRPNKSN